MTVIAATALPGSAQAAVDRAGISPGTCAEPLGVTVDADGDFMHEFRFPNGLRERHRIPGPDFDPGTASPERLRKLGLPPRPSAGAADQADWTRLADNLARRPKPQPSCGRLKATALRTAPVAARSALATVHTPSYSGYRATAASGKSYEGIHASYTAPSYYLSTCSRESMTQWVGITDDANFLIQIGVYVDQFAPTPTEPLDASAFYQIVGGGTWQTFNEVPLRTVPYVAGHRYYFAVEYIDRFSWHFIVNDLTSGAGVNFDVYNPQAGATQFIQPYGYFTSERLTHLIPDPENPAGEKIRVLTQYMNHSPVRFRNAMVHIYGEGDARLSIQRPEQVIMHTRNGDRLGNVDPLEVSASNFTEHWARCGLVEEPW